MVKHIVFFRVQSDIYNKEQVIQDIIDILLPLKNKIPQIKFYELGINFADKKTAFDLALISEFNNAKDLEIYRKHPEHIKAVEKIKNFISETAVVDYEI